MRGNPHGLEGNPPVTEGNPSSLEDNPHVTEGNPSSLEDNPPVTEGNRHAYVGITEELYTSKSPIGTH
jgi:hypothetical protein